MKNIPIGEVLKEYGYITEEQLAKALEYQKSSGSSKRLGSILIEMGYVTERQMLAALAKRLGQPLIDLDVYQVEVEAVEKIPKALAVKYNMLGISLANGRLTLATSDPLNFYAVEDIRLVANMPVSVCLAEKRSIDKAIDYYYAEIKAKEAVSDANLNVEEPAFDLAGDLDENDDTPVVKLLNSLLIRGYNTNASDIHIEPFEDKTQVRMRIDGMIIDYVTLSKSLHPSLIARTKILSNMDIAEKRVPQDGHFRTKVEGFDMNIRVSVIPTVYGEKAVLRFLNTNTQVDHSGQFGMELNNYNKLIDMLNTPHGIIYLTGPTGSGKTTTLYMALEHLAKKQVNISTIEDPVERNLPKVNQMQVNNLAGLTFESGLRALLRQDPDIIMVGETRDSETASISVRAAITGHLVLSTLHTNDAISAIVRLQDMGVEPYMIANSLNGVVAQRLVRKICPHCKQAYRPTSLEQRVVGEDVTELYRGAGCHLCNHTGYKGRIGVHEVIAIDRNMRKMISNNEDVEAIYDYVVKQQELVTLQQSATMLVRDGVTTMDELNKITCYID